MENMSLKTISELLVSANENIIIANSPTPALISDREGWMHEECMPMRHRLGTGSTNHRANWRTVPAAAHSEHQEQSPGSQDSAYTHGLPGPRDISVPITPATQAEVKHVISRVPQTCVPKWND